MEWSEIILRGTRNLSFLLIRFRLFEENGKMMLLNKIDEIEFKEKSKMRSRYSKLP